jgi:hypothetical protein
MERRLARLEIVWQRPPCPECAARPALVCVGDEDHFVGDADHSAPDYPTPRGLFRRSQGPWFAA